MWTMIDPAFGLGIAVAVVVFCLLYYGRALYEHERERDDLLAEREKVIRRLEVLLDEKKPLEPSYARDHDSCFHSTTRDTAKISVSRDIPAPGRPEESDVSSSSVPSS